jgi:hypothetical protein
MAGPLRGRLPKRVYTGVCLELGPAFLLVGQFCDNNGSNFSGYDRESTFVQ